MQPLMLQHLQPSFDDLSTPLYDVTFCVLDLETTGGSAAACEITEIGAIKVRGGETVGTFQTLVNPGLEIPPSIVLLTGITHAMVVEAPRIETALPSFLEFIGDAVIVGHNVRFDLSFLNAAITRLGYSAFRQRSVDTAALARRLVRSEVRNLRLGTLAQHFRSPVTPNHRALADAIATAHVFHGLLERAGALGVSNIDDLLQLPTAKGSAHYSKISLTESLPRRPGVYKFLNRDREVIYVGKASNLRSRVRQYFYGDTRRRIHDLLRELNTIDHIECPTDLEASITELRLIHTHRPRYNRRSKPPKSSHFVKLTDERFPRLSVVRSVRDDGLAYLGPFRSKKSADLVVAALWDTSQVRRCTSKTTTRSSKCAPAQLGIALCPCDGSIEKTSYSAALEPLLEGIRGQAPLLLNPLVEKMHRLSAKQRYEEAGWVRDRHDALARAIALRLKWNQLQEMGAWEAETTDGSRVLVDQGRLVHTWRLDTQEPLRPDFASRAKPQTAVPHSVGQAEEASLIWRWLENERPRIAWSNGSLPENLPVIPLLKAG